MLLIVSSCFIGYKRSKDLKEQGTGLRRHPWEIANVKTLKRIFRLCIDDPAHKKFLDIGRGDAFVLNAIQYQFGSFV